MKKKVCVILWLACAILMAFAMVSPVMVFAEEATDKYGSVTSLVGTADIKVDKTEKVDVLYNELELQWCEADPTIGRTVSGWWIGIKVTAPTAYNGDSEENLKNSVFKSNGEEYNFWTVKDSKDDEATQYVNIWSYVDKEKLKGGDTATIAEYEFDWDNDSTYEQTVAVKVVPEKVTLQKDEGIVSVTIGDRQFTLHSGETLSDLTEKEKELLAKITEAPDGKVFVGLFKEDGTELKSDEKITEDTVVEVRFEDAEKEVPEQPADEGDRDAEQPAEVNEASDEAPDEAPAGEKDDSPKTGNVSIIGYVAIVAVIAAIGIVVLNKRK